MTTTMTDDDDDDDKDRDKDRDRDEHKVRGSISRSWDTSVRISLASTVVRTSVELPRTSTAPDPSGTLVALLAVLAGSGLILRRWAQPRR